MTEQKGDHLYTVDLLSEKLINFLNSEKGDLTFEEAELLFNQTLSILKKKKIFG